ncbi:hypothetical protein CBR_g3872 [Chara braunii]|uniref:Uncharacterized protein n=1 Tax=Chara braunii TaxID=69332 RepID=A0A388KGJ8_CHABU|nr:hypothetical protein CBR_g3872 [Chara braunii]|eukprot:GBG69172.1 hypothetical protein CBR_g3872 [Chara braunii]
MELREKIPEAAGVDAGRQARSPPQGPHLEEEDDARLRELCRICYAEGIMPTGIDPGVMTIDGREARFKVNSTIDQVKINGLKEHTVTVIFRAGARFLPRNIKDDSVRAYEDRRSADGTFEQQNFSMDRVKVESPNVVSYVAKSKEVARWLVEKGEDEVTVGSLRYVFEFKPWLTKAQLRQQRLLENEQTFWVIAVQVPLDAFIFLQAQVERAVGPVIRTFPPEQDRMFPSLVNIKFEIEPAARGNMKDKIWIDTSKGNSLEAKIASADTPRCRRCRAFFHTDVECRRNQQPQGQPSAPSGPHASSPAGSRQNQGPLRPRPASPSVQSPQGPGPVRTEAAAISTSLPATSGTDMRANPVYSPGVHAAPPYFSQHPILPQSEFPWMHGPGETWLYSQFSYGGAHQYGMPFPSVLGSYVQQSAPMGSSFPIYSSVVPTIRPLSLPQPSAPGHVYALDLNRGVGNHPQGGTAVSGVSIHPSPSKARSGTPGKQRRIDQEGSFVSGRADLEGENSVGSSQDLDANRSTIGVTGSKTSRRRIPISLSRGQLQDIENRILPFFCVAVHNSFWVIAFVGMDGSPTMVSLSSPDTLMLSAVAILVRTAIHEKFSFRLIPDVIMSC